MTPSRRHDFRLSSHPPAFFIEALEAALTHSPEIITPGEPGGGRYGKRRTFLWDLFGDGRDGFDFHLVVFSDAGAPAALYPLIRSVFAQLIAMDDAARTIPSAGDENEYLLSVTLDADSGLVQLDYAASAVNSEWSVHFRSGADGTFACLGIPDWRTPGQYIT